ncbi:hypothetical protein [Nonomuraea lactucae]|uniref:hypothetical protein n=1 Tax=Nonomuraea lactucae TaxID=2249762 RepID=UPI0013B37224|nr:hypothetical protein [Nonomuraea lactucae]
MTVFPVEDGVVVVPAVLPLRVTSADLKMTVAEWLRLTPLEAVVSPDDEDSLPPRPYRDADVTEYDPDQSEMPQVPGSAVEDEDPDEEEVKGGQDA